MGTRRIVRATCVALGLFTISACAGGDVADGTGQVTFGVDSGEASQGSAGEGTSSESADSQDASTEAEESEADTSEAVTSSDTTDTTDGCGACDSSPGDCYDEIGQCVGGTCEYGEKIAGTTCEGTGICDSMGTCLGGEGDCNKPHATGTMTGGSCGDWVCESGWGDCNNDIDTDGCEINTDEETANCGTCGTNCAGPNLSASCNAGSCERTCDGDFENCDGDWQTGCEIPTGVPAMCDMNGIRMDGEGCWTAYCGANAGANGNFGTYHCVHCANCNVPSAGDCRWCDSASGSYFPTEAGCGCGAFEDLVCGP